MDRSGLKALFQSHYNNTATPEQRAAFMWLVNEADPEELEMLIMEFGENLDITDPVITPDKSEKILLSILEKSQAEAMVHQMETGAGHPSLSN